MGPPEVGRSTGGPLDDKGVPAGWQANEVAGIATGAFRQDEADRTRGPCPMALAWLL
jgi:hypothetical protein